MRSVCLWIQQKQMYSCVCFVIKHVHPMMHCAPCASSENTTMAATVQYIAADTTNYWNGAMRNKFLHFHRTVSIVNSIQFDHLFPRVGNTNIVFAVFSHLSHLALTMWHPRNLAIWTLPTFTFTSCPDSLANAWWSNGSEYGILKKHKCSMVNVVAAICLTGQLRGAQTSMREHAKPVGMIPSQNHKTMELQQHFWFGHFVICENLHILYPCQFTGRGVLIIFFSDHANFCGQSCTNFWYFLLTKNVICRFHHFQLHFVHFDQCLALLAHVCLGLSWDLWKPRLRIHAVLLSHKSPNYQC